jgi:hypothetical protein
LPMKNCSVLLDGHPVIEHGRVTEQQLRVQG